MANTVYGDYVIATEAVAAQGVPVSFNSQDGMAIIGGKAYKPDYITPEGKAVMSQYTVNQAVADFKNASGYQDPNDIAKKYKNEYASQYKNLTNRLTNRDYDIKSNPIWTTYEDLYLREGNRAMENTMANMAGMTGGFVNSAAVSAAAGQRNLYNQKLMDNYDDLWQLNYNLDRNALDAVMGLDKLQYNREYTANTDLYNRIKDERNYSTKRDETAYEQKRQATLDEYNIKKTLQELAKGEIDMETAVEKLAQLQLQGQLDKQYAEQERQLGVESQQKTNDGKDLDNQIKESTNTYKGLENIGKVIDNLIKMKKV